MQLAGSEFGGENTVMELSARLNEDFGAKLKVVVADEEEERGNFERLSQDEFEYGGDREAETEEEDDEGGGEEESGNRERLSQDEFQYGGDNDEETEEEEEFSFDCLNRDGSPITADEAFQDGQIRPVFPLFNRDLLFIDGAAQPLRPPLKKLFVEDNNGGGEAASSSEPQGPYCSWSGKTVRDASPETCRKSNSTGFAKLRRFRDLVLRSNSDGKDAFVFLNSNSAKNQTIPKRSQRQVRKAGGKGGETAASAHERLYMRNRAMREEDKRKSYLPYKQVGFFTDVKGLSRNIHPF